MRMAAMARSVLVTSWVFLLLCLAVSAAPTPTFPSINSSVEADCRLRGLVLEFVSSLASPETVGDWQGSAYDALQLHRCSSSLASLLATHTLPFPPRSHTPLPTAYPLRSSQRKRRSPPSPTPSPCPWEVFVDGQHGSDNNPGNLSHPLATLHHALALSRAVPRTPPSSRTVACITVRAGIYYLGDRAPTVDSSQFDSRVGAISLTSIDSGLTLRGYPGENVTLSGGVPLTSLTWAKWGGGQVRSSPLPSSSSLPALDRWHFNELYVDGQRAIPAKYPNGNPATHGLWNGLGWIPAAQSWLPPRPTPAATEVHVASPSRPDEQFSAYDMAIGGGAAVFDPPRNVWSQAAPNAGGRYVVPSGLVYSGTALQQRAVNWTDVSSGYVFALHDGHWGSWVFDIAGHSAGTQSITFGAGGFQEARGSGGGAEFYVSHILEELDDGLEWFVDYAKRTLYFQPNASTPATTLVASQLPCILSMQGTRANPIHHVTVSGITFTETANTLLRPYEVPSGGDWSVHRGGAVFVEGSEACSVTQNRFVQLAGNALVVSDYNDALDVVWNEFAWLGESAVVLLGSVDGIDGVGSYRSPMYTDVVGNLIREVGAAVKQTAGVVQFLSGASLIARNAIFNGPRAGVNINDGFYGGTELVENAMFSVVRETTDHGNINSWDRTPYLTDSGAGPSLRPLTNFITANLLLAQYHSVWPIDHDDGSAWYEDSYNVLLYGGAKGYLGHSKVIRNQLYLYPDGDRFDGPIGVTPFAVDARTVSKYGQLGRERLGADWGAQCAQYFGQQVDKTGWDEQFHDNVCVQHQSEPMDVDSCSFSTPSIIPTMYNNTYYQVGGVNVSWTCDGQLMTLAQFQSHGYDVGSRQLPAPDLSVLLDMARSMLSIGTAHRTATSQPRSRHARAE